MSPGPWRWSNSHGRALVQDKVDGDCVAWAGNASTDVLTASAADARLIAAAPEMLALLRRCRHGVEVAIDEGVGDVDVLTDLYALLARIDTE